MRTPLAVRGDTSYDLIYNLSYDINGSAASSMIFTK
jgi:hypothetical protein